jgi:CDP-4-dehydro-6-deoxyglucose reductase
MTSGSFRIRLEPHARELTATADESLLDAALAAGLNLPHSCKSGHCTSCRATLRAGEIFYPHGLPLGLTQAESDAGRVLLCQARARSELVVEVRMVARAGDVEIRRLPCRIERRTLLAPDVLQLHLRPPAAEPLPFQPGQYLDILLEQGRRRSFSIASPPHDAGLLELHVRRAPGTGFTANLFDAAPVGTLLRIEGPIGQFIYAPSAAPLLLVAGGTGFAPLKSILRHVLEVEQAARPVHFYWGARTAADAYEDDWLLELCARHPQLAYTAVLSEQQHATRPHQRTGWVHDVVARECPDIASADAYVAGPPGLVEALQRQYVGLGLDPARIRFDSFDYAPR